jgi:HlyD family secretion protein
MKRGSHPWIPLAAVLLAACGDEQRAGVLRVSGHVEATEIQVAPEVSGRILERPTSEGDRVASGDVIARLDARDTELQLRRLQAERAAADANRRLLAAGPRPEEVRQADAQAEAAAAEIATIEAELDAARMDLERFEALLAAHAGSVKQRDDARARVETLEARRRAASERLRAARENAERIRSGARRQELEAAAARVAAIDAQIAVLDEAIHDAVVKAPVSGIVTQTLAEAGELVGPGRPIVVITDLDHAWANLFVPEPMIPRLRLGQAATVFTDAGGPGLPGTVTFISPRAEFTPRNVQTPEERSRLVYRIKVSVDNRDGILKPGMPVDAELRLE